MVSTSEQRCVASGVLDRVNFFFLGGGIAFMYETYCFRRGLKMVSWLIRVTFTVHYDFLHRALQSASYMTIDLVLMVMLVRF